MAETQSTSPQATAPTGDIKIFIDDFNKEFELEIKKLTDAVNNLKNIYADAIKISTPRTTSWPKDESVKTIGDLFKYTFPDIDNGVFIEPPKGIQPGGIINQEELDARKNWEKDLNTAKEFFTSLKKGIRGSTKLNDYNQVKKPGVTNPSLYSPGQYYFDVFMSVVLSENGPLKSPDGSNGGEAFDFDYRNNPTYGGSVSISQFDPSGEVELSKHDGSLNNVVFDYYEFRELIQRGYVGTAVYDKVEKYTGIDIGLDNDGNRGKYSGNFPGLRTQYRSGNYDQLKTDPKFNEERGDLDETTKEFWGGFELTSLYKAFLQAGDNYKSLVLPLRNPEPIAESTPDLISPPLLVVTPDPDELTFNVEKQNTFIVVGGTVSPPMEYVIVSEEPNQDGDIQAIFNDYQQLDYDELGDEYTEGEFMGTEEELWPPPPPVGYPAIDTETINSLKGVNESNADSLSTSSTDKYPASKDKDANIKEFIKQAKKAGVTNKFAIVGMLAIISKESGFVPKSEYSYRGTSGARCQKIFGKRGKTEAQWEELTKNDKAFFDFIYGGKYGNAADEGYKYRGRGLNQITFKAIYEKYGKATGYDIVKDPDLLNTIEVAAACAVSYFKTGLNGAPGSIKRQYNFTDVNSFKNLDDATGAVYHCNAGFGHTYADVVADSTGGRAKAFKNAGPLYNTYSSQIA